MPAPAVQPVLPSHGPLMTPLPEKMRACVKAAPPVAVALALGGCFQTVLDAYDVSARYPQDPSAKACAKPADCLPSGGGGGGGD